MRCSGAAGVSAPEQIQFKNTATTDLTSDEDALLAAMKSKWRYNIRLAEKRGVSVRLGEEARSARVLRISMPRLARAMAF
jgi:lipid II:glycine glycyltransferase (peptidoglycan interpeptide bridge formation enzyme)